MAIVELYSGSATIGTTEFSLTNASTVIASRTTQGAYQAVLDFNNLAFGDEYRVYIREKCRAASTQKIWLESGVENAPPLKLFNTVILPLMHGWDFTCKKVAGTDRTISWSIRQISGTLTGLYENTNTISTTEFSLPNNSTTPASKTDSGLITCFLDTSTIVQGDVFIFKQKEKARAADTQREFISKLFANVSHDDTYLLPPQMLYAGWDMTLDKLSGTDRAFEWSIRSA